MEYKDFESDAIEQIYISTKGDMRKFSYFATTCFFVMCGQKSWRVNNNQTKKSVCLAGYRVDSVDFWITTDRRDLTSEQIAEIYKLRWDMEIFLHGGNVTCECIT